MYEVADDAWCNVWAVYDDAQSQGEPDEKCLEHLGIDFVGPLPEEWTYINGVVYNNVYKG